MIVVFLKFKTRVAVVTLMLYDLFAPQLPTTSSEAFKQTQSRLRKIKLHVLNYDVWSRYKYMKRLEQQHEAAAHGWIQIKERLKSQQWREEKNLQKK